MWLWHSDLRALGFTQASPGYWQCERGHGLPMDVHLSIFPWCRPGRSRRRAVPALCEVCAFHVTFEIGVDNVHFYYHEMQAKVWEPGGHTSAREIRHLRRRPRDLRRAADAIAEAFVAALGGQYRARRVRKRV